MDRVWLAQYPDGVAGDIDPDAFPSVAAVFDQSCERFGERAAFRNMGTALSFRDFEARARDFAAYLQNDLGLAKGERIALMMPNVLQYPVALYGALRAGLVVVNINPLYTAREVADRLVDARPRAIVIVENFARALQDAQSRYTVEHVIVTGLGDMLGAWRGAAVNLAVRHLRRMVPAWAIAGTIRWNDALERGATRDFEPPALAGEDLAFLQYTGGTTGAPKGAMLTHRNMVANLEQISAWLGRAEASEVVITPLPLYHIFSLTANLLTFVKHGGTNVLVTNPRDIRGLVKTLREEPFTALTAVNTLFNGLLRNADFRQLDFSHLNLAVGGGMAVQRSVAERWQSVTGTVIIEGYGLTETSPVVCANPLYAQAFSGTVGFPVPSTDVSIRDAHGAPLAYGEAGELCIRGPQVMAGYWEKPEDTKEAFFDDGWFRSGDVAEMDEQGWVRIVDRMKDVIVVSGFNVYPNEIEDVAAGYEGVAEAACVGIAHVSSGEVPKLYVVPAADHELDVDALKAYLREQLTSYKIPKRIEIRDELPKSNIGKILRRVLRDSDREVTGGAGHAEENHE
ncbi:MAG: AMP-binding protein [Halofilum sp. (in: g-proteobacteria)]